ncbi:hypothetical protein G6F46_003175 [Rhizopus delemar]|uniref:Peptide hydrolase n=3 Tax=Rhizopus TaxID=4842 RepID=I1BZ49_RHIO9|nr:hypothetical protein RO3G_06184 [Rhizopus delemar RA 99-880]KAG1460852.1 hypothetical protein G6F55_003915 [Rhizopus delemar]KAG1549006.1 hypothetical protein G6F51_003316 [Rhizopus arrhizus]KAG1502118.1 hypothetical protein G6F54_002576 [Rhizopus delemar]KAG1510495.1 hypothetical protein G6F52_010887 [Rhizopus delemar]|eukprot:EIE81479.1 hypothetical protein RO3G_06184 [Rhizopus delemar RA 99-880]
MKLFSLTVLSVSALSALVSASPLVSKREAAASSNSERRLIQLSEDAPAKWMTESEKLDLIRARTKFMDITDHSTSRVVSLANWTPYIPTKAEYQNEVKPFINQLNTKNMETILTTFSNFRNRYYKSTYGAQSCRWLIQQIKDVASGNSNVSVNQFDHSWGQFSIIARIEGSDASLKNELVIIGAHQDSINMYSPISGRAPGADDDGSGTVTILEAFRSLVQNGFKPERSVEFHWYSGEEGGLLGSQAVSSKYQQQGKKVVGMLQNDMTGYIGNNKEVIGIVTDHVDDKLTNFLKTLVDTYASIPYVSTKCGYACSDHASWLKYGFPSAFAIESTFEDSNQNIHSENDVIDGLSFNHMKEFSKLALGFAVELSHKRN